MTLRRIQRLPTSVGLAQARPNHVICWLSRDQRCRLADESRASGTFTRTLLISYGTGLLLLVLSEKVDRLPKYPAA